MNNTEIKSEMSKRHTPDTDAVAAYEGNWDTKALRMTAHARRLERERDEAREKIKRQAERIRELEGATNHAGGMKKIESIKYHGTDETDAMVELWESCHLPADFARRMEAERNEARRLADTRLDQLEAITSSEPKDYLDLVYACKSHRKHIAQLIKERDEAREEAEYWKEAAKVPSGIFRSLEMARDQAKRDAEYYRARYEKLKDEREAAK